MEEILDDKNEMIMKLLHYFITEQNYNPIILQGAENEIWLENLQDDYKIVRIVSNHIHNDEQLAFDTFKTKRVVKKIKRKTFTFEMKVLSIFTDLGDTVKLKKEDYIDSIYINDTEDIKKYDFVTKAFPDITKKLKFSEEGVRLFMKITSDINRKNKKDAEQANEVFKPKKPFVTIGLIIINTLIFLLTLFDYDFNIIDSFATNNYQIIVNRQFYRLLTGAFLHADVLHLLFNMYALYILGSQVETFLGHVKYGGVYIISAIVGSLLSTTLHGSLMISVGASGAIFGLMGALLYFGYHYRVYLGGVLEKQIIPIIIVNLLIGFMASNIDNYAHIGGLIGGLLASMAVGIKYKTSKTEQINGIIILILVVAFLSYMMMQHTF